MPPRRRVDALERGQCTSEERVGCRPIAGRGAGQAFGAVANGFDQRQGSRPGSCPRQEARDGFPVLEGDQGVEQREELECVLFGVDGAAYDQLC